MSQDAGQSTTRLRILLVLAVGVLPWTVVITRGIPTVVHPIGLLTLSPIHLVPTWEYLFSYTRGLPGYILAWPIGVVVYLAALASSTAGFFGREDRRVTAGLLVLVGLTQLSVAEGFTHRRAYVAIPVATITSLVVAWWIYRA